MPTTRSGRTPSTADLMALALDHRIWAENSTCPAEQLELHRVADIYEVLATSDFPISEFAEMESQSTENNRELADLADRRHDASTSGVGNAARRSDAAKPSVNRS